MNTGNFLHILRVDLIVPKSKSAQSVNDDVMGSMVFETSDVEDIDDNTTFGRSPGAFSIADSERDSMTEETSRASECDSVRETILLAKNSSSSEDSCGESMESESSPTAMTTLSTTNRSRVHEQRAISVRDKILQDFCEDVSQELNIGTDLITLVKHPACSPRSTPQRLPTTDLKTHLWPAHIHTPPSDILSTRNSESSQQTGSVRSKRPVSPQPGTSHDPLNIATSISSPLHSLSISPSPSPRLMSPPMSQFSSQFRHPSPRKRSCLHSPPLPTTVATVATRTRATHKLNLEAEKAYEFTDESQETCEKLSSFRKRRLADKKYEFTDEAEDAENIVPFKHIRDQFEHHRHCSGHRLGSTAVSPALSNPKQISVHRCETEHSEGEELYSSQDGLGYSDYQYIDSGTNSKLCWKQS